jgi:hypothetical protein
MEAIIGKNCNVLRIESEHLAEAFKAGELKNFKLEVNHNCCTNRDFTADLDFVYPDPDCDWEVFFATDLLDPAICVTPDGATCVDKFYPIIKGVLISNNGGLVNVLEGINYNITSANEADIVATIDEGLADAGYVNAYSSVEILDRGNGDFSISVRISGLPHGIVPQSIIMGNSTPCFARPYFKCTGSQPGAVCVEYSAAYTFPGKPKPGADLNFAYEIDYLLLTNPNTGLSEKLTVNFNFNYDINNPSVIDFTSVKNTVDSWLVLRGLTGITFDITLVNNQLIATFAGEDDVFVPIRFFLENETLNTVTQLEFDCSEFSVPNPVCEWESVIETIKGKYFSKTVVGLFLEPSPGAFIQNALSQAYDITNLSDRTALIAEAEDYFDSINYPDVTVQIDEEDGLDTDSQYRIKVIGYPNTVLFAKVMGTDGDYSDADFICADIDFIPATYDPDKIELIPEGLLVKPSFLGGSETIPDGVYAVKLSVEKEDLTKTIERACVFSDCTIKCNMISALAKDPTSDIHHYYEGIKDAADCPDCECEKACQLYEVLLKKVNYILGRNDEPCSCSGC